MIICLGPVCVPVYAVLPFLMAVFVRFKETILAWWNGTSAADEVHCENGVCELKTPLNGTASPQESSAPSSGTSPLPSWDETTKEVVHLKDSDAWETLKKDSAAADRVFVAKFTAEWCGPCKKIAPVYKEICAEVNAASNAAKFVEVDVDELDDVSADANISAMPTFVVFKGGNEVERTMGAREDQLRAMVAKHCK